MQVSRFCSSKDAIGSVAARGRQTLAAILSKWAERGFTGAKLMFGARLCGTSCKIRLKSPMTFQKEGTNISKLVLSHPNI